MQNMLLYSIVLLVRMLKALPRASASQPADRYRNRPAGFDSCFTQGRLVVESPAAGVPVDDGTGKIIMKRGS